MMKNIVIISTLDTKAEETEYLKNRIEARRHRAVLFDIGYGGAAATRPDVSCEEVVKAAGTTQEDFLRFRAARNRDALSQIVCIGAVAILKKMISDKRVDGIISIGGTSSAAMVSVIMNELPHYIPQLIFTSAAPLPSSYRFFGSSGVTVMHSLTEVGGLNSILKGQLDNAAGAICGMAENNFGEMWSAGKKRIAMTTNGWCEKTAHYIIEKLGSEFDIVRFHAIGQPEVVMEKLVDNGFFDAVIDLVPSSITNKSFNGTRISWDRRLTVAGEKGIPQIIAPDLINVISRIRADTPEQREEISRRKYYYPDKIRILLWLSREELLDMAPIYAERLNKAVGPTTVLFPMKGWASIERDGADFYEPELENEFMMKLKSLLSKNIEVLEVNANIDDIEFADTIIEQLESALSVGRLIYEAH